MNLTLNNSFFCSVNIHKKAIIVNHNSKNIIYRFEDYKLLLEFIKKSLGEKEKNNVLEYIRNNSEIIKQLIIKDIKTKKKQKTNPNQTSLF